MSARASKQTKGEARDSERLRFLIDCMTDEELIRHDLMRADKPRPSNLQLRKEIDAKRQRFYKAHRRLTGKYATLPRFSDEVFGRVDELLKEDGKITGRRAINIINDENDEFVE